MLLSSVELQQHLTKYGAYICEGEQRLAHLQIINVMTVVMLSWKVSVSNPLVSDTLTVAGV